MDNRQSANKLTVHLKLQRTAPNHDNTLTNTKGSSSNCFEILYLFEQRDYIRKSSLARGYDQLTTFISLSLTLDEPMRVKK